MNRRRLVLSAAGAGLAVSGLAVPAALAESPTDDELAYANFGLATEFLLKDFYAKSAAAKLFTGSAARDLVRSGFSAGEHAVALANLLTGAGQTASVEEDFEFAWPEGTFGTKASALKAGLATAQPLLGVYVCAAATISIESYRTLFVSLSANLAQQVAALSQLSGGRLVGAPFPAALSVQNASDAIETLLG